MEKQQTSTLWGGRFSESTDAFVQRFTASVDFDRRLAMHDIRGSLAHAAMLQRAGLLSESEYAAIVAGLGEIRREMVESGQPVLGVDLTTPDFAAVARAFGARGETLEDAERLPGLVSDAFAAPPPTLIEVRL